MKQAKTIYLGALLMIMSLNVMAQRKKQVADTVSVYREFAKLGQWYQQMPLHVNIRFSHRTLPSSPGQDSTETNMTLYYGKNDFYMQAEGMEQIANDSLLVLVNNESKMIKLYPNNGAAQRSLQSTALMFTNESSLQALMDRYSASMQEEGQDRKRITLQSREKVFGTDLPKERISISYQAGTLQPVTFDQSKRSLIPIDSSVYGRLLRDPAYSGKLVSTKGKDEVMYFLVKEQQAGCRFTKIDHDMQAPPARQEDRVARLSDGTYQPAKDFSNYLLSKEF